MKKVAVIALAALALAAFSGSASAAVLKNVCWQLSPYSDTIKVSVKQIDLDPKKVVTATWLIDVNGHPQIVPMTGSLMTDLDGTRRLSLMGTVRDLSFSRPFIYSCTLDANLDPHTLESVDIYKYGDPNPHPSVLAGCEGYFQPDNPFTSDVRLVRVSCSSVNNP